MRLGLSHGGPCSWGDLTELCGSASEVYSAGLALAQRPLRPSSKPPPLQLWISFEISTGLAQEVGLSGLRVFRCPAPTPRKYQLMDLMASKGV
jgi:hypothetical protein